MATETLQLRDRENRKTPVQAELTRYSTTARLVRGGAIAIIGTVVGLCTIIIPVLHLISVWLVPLVSWFVGWFVYKIDLVVHVAEGNCPGCDKRMTIEVGAVSDDTWVRCPSCALPMQFEVGGNAPAV